MVSRIHHRKAAGIPDFITKIAVAFNAGFIEFDVAPLRCKSGQRKSKRIGAIFCHHEKRVDHIPLGFAHFLAKRVTDQSMNMHVFKRDFAHKMNPHHHHAGHPEENNIKGSY
ncbi:MAG: hypothetical protein ACD_73C00522G0001 [uncultured bacterium]|nr:MAG: hypothetical protein ACD_73C00522G0001 [uncultured bacterium]